ncbi:MAG: [protein-PII] uridylyltransferase [Nitrospirae bacterium]|nr:[protein-PII] uridylyltransferase [Nitrospirota bacterium]
MDIKNISAWVAEHRELSARQGERTREAHFSGAGGLAVVRAITAQTDYLVSAAFGRVCEETGVRPETSGWALTAIGGYGRSEMNPYSDVDIMFLGRDGTSGREEVFPTRVLHILWDLGMNIGYSVRCADDCRALAKDDTTVMTSLLEARFVFGDRRVYDGFTSKMGDVRRPRAVDDYIREKLSERQKRHKKHGDSVFLREPNLKEGAGGLRDIHAAMWISRIKYGVDTLGGLVPQGIIKENELRRLRGAKDYLLRLRSEMHYLSGHRQDVLTYELQERAASDFGYIPSTKHLAVENFMRAYYLRARAVRDITQAIIEKSVGGPAKRWWFTFPEKKKPLDPDFYMMGRTICLGGDATEVFRSRPEALLQAFSHSQEQGVPMSDNLSAAVADNVKAINAKARESVEAGRVFLGMLGRLDRLYETLELMHRLKALGRFLPEFGGVSAMVQHDLYHMYTVDEHSLLAVRKVQALVTSEGMAYPSFKDALGRIKDRQVLMLSVLMHDTGKAAGNGHAEHGARLARGAALRLGLDEPRAAKVELLVRNHLLMAHISHRRELSDPGVIEKFCRIIKDRELLDMLYVLTFADMSTVGPDTFNDWRASLLRELYERSAAFLTDSASVIAYENKRVEKFLAAMTKEVKADKLGKSEEVAKFLANLPPQYMLTVPLDTAVRHFSLARGLKSGGVIIDHVDSGKGYTDLSVILFDMLGLFYFTAGVLAANGMNILSAQIFTGRDGIVIDTLQVTDYNKQVASDEALWRKVESDLMDVLTGRTNVERLMPARPAYPRRAALAAAPPRVVVDNEASDRFTVIDVFAADRVGLLHDITQALFNANCYISLAKIDTRVDQVIDVFYVSDVFKHKIEDKERIDALRESLVAAVSTEGR